MAASEAHLLPGRPFQPAAVLQPGRHFQPAADLQLGRIFEHAGEIPRARQAFQRTFELTRAALREAPGAIAPF